MRYSRNRKKPGWRGLWGEPVILMYAAFIIFSLGIVVNTGMEVFNATETGLSHRVKELVNENLSQNGSPLRITGIDNMNCRESRKSSETQYQEECQAAASYSDGTEGIICITELRIYGHRQKYGRKLVYTKVTASQCGNGPDFAFSREYR